MIFVLQTRYTSNEESGGGNLVFLDRLRVSCDTGAVTSFKLEREGDRVCKRLRFAFSCCCVLSEWPVRECRQIAEQSRCSFYRRRRLCHIFPRVSALAKCPLESSLTVP